MRITPNARRINKFICGTLICIATLSLSGIAIISAITHGQIDLTRGDQKIILTARNVNTDRYRALNSKTTSSSVLPVPSDTFFILVIGNDERPGVGGARADAIH